MITVKLPNKIQVGGHWYKLVLDSRVKDFGQRADINYEKQRISINPNQPQSQKEESFLHEALHFVEQVYCRGDVDEAEIDSLSQGIWQVLAQLGIEFDFSGLEIVEA